MRVKMSKFLECLELETFSVFCELEVIIMKKTRGRDGSCVVDIE